MTFLRHAGRHVHKTVLDHLRTHLAALGWDDPSTTPYGATPVTLISRPVVLGDRLDDALIKSGLVAVTLGDEYHPDMEEVGGPLASQEYPFFIDVFQDNEAVCTALATDVRDIFMARFPNTKRILPVKDGATGLAVAGWTIEFEDITRVRPDTSLPYYWQTVKVTATAYFPEVVY